ncbi:MAG: ScyD/ScyE family protein, partial [Balneolaceae bacterium]
VSTTNLKDLLNCSADGNDLCDLPDQIPAQAVPTSIAKDSDGYYYVGELKGFPAPTGASNIWKVSPGASGVVCGSSPDCVKAFDGGFTSIIDLAFGPDGYLYVAELDEQSWFAVEELGGGVGGTINKCDLETGTCTEVATGIPILTAITFDKDGALWATKNALIPGSAEVIKIP